MTQTAEAPYVITYSEAIEERISGLEAELTYYRDAYNQLYQEKKFIDHLFEVEPEKLTTGHKASIHATVRYLRAHERDRDERGYIKMDAYEVARMAGHSYGTILNHWGATSRELRMREGFEVETDIGNVPVFDRLVIRIPTDDRDRYPQGYYLETYMKERPMLADPEHYQAQTPIEWGGKRKDAGRKKCKRCGVWMKPKDHVRTMQREHICPQCHTHEWDEVTRVSDDMPVDAPVEQHEASKNQVEFCSPEAAIEPSEASKPQLDEVIPAPILCQVADCSPEALTHAPPEALRSLKIWCPWRYEQPEKPRADGKLDKVPYRTYGRSPQKAKSNDRATWSTYDEAVAAVERSHREGWKEPFEGIGFMCNGEFTGVDLDHCISGQGEISDQALDLVALFGSYTYITPSGAGLRIIIHAKKPGDRCRWPGVEIYDQVRFFTWTPDHLDGTPETIEDGQAELDALFAEIAPPAREAPKVEPQFTCSRSDDEILEKAGKAPNGAKFRALYQGNTAGYSSQSEADLALCRMLAYWADGDVSTINRLFRQSRLVREKWDRSVGAGETYGERTIRIALGQRQERRAS